MKKHHLLLLGLITTQVSALTPREQAWKLHNRLTGVPPKANTLMDMENLIAGGRMEDAAMIATDNPLFISVVLKNWVKPWSNRDQSVRVDLNDYVATVLGVVRDDRPFTEVLTGDVLYTINGSPTAYSPANNDHYKNGELQVPNLKVNLMRNTQSAMNGLPATATSGVVTTRASGEAFFSAGTNRRVNRFTFINYMCKDYEQLHDITIPDFHVRRDVERNPGGDTRTYKNKCVGCHAGQDALGGAYAYYEFQNNMLVYTPGMVQPKINQNAANYPDGYVTVDDSWINLWATGQNANLGWKGNTSGNGARAINSMFANSRAFSKCIATKVFQLVCLKKVVNTVDQDYIETAATSFESDYNLKKLIVKTSARCVGNEE